MGDMGAVNDAVRLHKAEHARFEAEAVLQEFEAAALLHLEDRRDLGKAVVVENGLSWPRTDVVETLMELPGAAVEDVIVKDPLGNPVPSQLLSRERADEERVDYQLDDPDLAKWQVKVAFRATDVPATGYKTFYISEGRAPDTGETLEASMDILRNDHWEIRLEKGWPVSAIHLPSGRNLVKGGKYRFHQLVAMEDLRGNLEDGYDPWDPQENQPNFTGKEWRARVQAKKLEVVETGPFRAIVRIPGKLEDSPFVQEIHLHAGLDRIDWHTEIDWQGTKHRQVRLMFPFNLKRPKIRYETPFGSVLFGKDEMPNTYRGDGTRWVQKWIDLSEKEFGVTMGSGCCAVNFSRTRVAPVLLSTTYCRGDAFYWVTNPGMHRFRFSIKAHGGDHLKDRAYGLGWEQWLPLRTFRPNPRLLGVEHLRRLPDEAGFLRCDHPAVVITALKKADDGEAFVLRLYNTGGEKLETRVGFGFPVVEAVEASLTEQPNGDAGYNGRELPVVLGPYAIKTYRFGIES
jgi:alpha-mannosidase